MNEEIVSRLKRVTRSTNRVYVNFDNIGKNTITLIPYYYMMYYITYNLTPIVGDGTGYSTLSRVSVICR